MLEFEENLRDPGQPKGLLQAANGPDSPGGEGQEFEVRSPAEARVPDLRFLTHDEGEVGPRSIDAGDVGGDVGEDPASQVYVLAMLYLSTLRFENT